MSFERIESFDYSTENMDNESIQDKIDAKTLEISQLTKESLKELKVDIQNENSSLTLRDNDGNYLGKVRDNEVLIYEGEAKPVEYKGSQKLFLKVRTKTGKVGFVSADYLKAKVNQDKIHVQKAANDWEIKAPVAPIKQEKAKKDINSKKEEKTTNENIPYYLQRRENTPLNSLKKSSENTTEILETKEITETELSNWLDLKIAEIKEITKDTENLETLWVIWDGKEDIENNKMKLNQIYSEILLILNQLQKINTPTAQTKVKKMYLFLAEYYSDNKENIENDHLRDYTLSTVNALWVIKDVPWCPSFPNLEEIQKEYPNKEDFQRELELAMNAFDARFEDFSDRLDTKDTNVLKAIALIEDNRWIGWFDFAEEITDAIYNNIGGIWAMLTGTIAIVFASPWLLIWWAIAGWAAIAGAGINAVAKWQTTWREFAADAASLAFQVWTAGTIALKSSAILAKTTGVWRTAWVLWAEATADVAVVWVLWEWIHESFEWNDMQWTESFKQNLIWAPLVLLGGWKTLFRETMEKVQLRKAIWDTEWMLTEMKKLNIQLTDVKEKFSWKSFIVEVEGHKYPVEISNTWELKLFDTQRVLDPSIKGDKKIIKALAAKIYQANTKGDFTNWKIHLESEKVSHTKVNQETQTTTIKNEHETSTQNVNNLLYVNKRWTVHTDLIPKNTSSSIEIDGIIYDLKTTKNWKISIFKDWKQLNIKEVDIILEKHPHKIMNSLVEKKSTNNLKTEKTGNNEQKTYAKETISQDEYLRFRDQWKVSDQRLDSIVEKHRKWEPLSKYETEILHSDIPKWDAEIRVWKKMESEKIQDEPNQTDKSESVENTKSSTEANSSQKKETWWENTQSTTSKWEKIKNFNADSRLNEILKKKFQTEDSIVIKSNDGDTITIRKTANWKFTLWDENQLYKNIKKVTQDLKPKFKEAFIDNENFDQIMKLTKRKTFDTDKTLGIPYTWKVKFRENWEIEIKRNGKYELISDKAKIKEVISEPKMRQAILKQELEKISWEDIYNNLSKLEWFDKIKALPKETVMYLIDRAKWILITTVAGWTTWMFVEFLWSLWDNEPNETFLQEFYRYAWAFAQWAFVWAGIWITINWARTVVKFWWDWITLVWKVAGKAWNHKWKILTVWTVWAIWYEIFDWN